MDFQIHFQYLSFEIHNLTKGKKKPSTSPQSSQSSPKGNAASLLPLLHHHHHHHHLFCHPFTDAFIEGGRSLRRHFYRRSHSHRRRYYRRSSFLHSSKEAIVPQLAVSDSRRSLSARADSHLH